MLKVLIRKQFQECFRSYFVNAKTGKARKKAGMIGMFAFFGVLILFLAAVFFGVSYAVGEPLFELHLEWLFFALIGVLSVLLGTFGSVFNTYAVLYLSKDNEMLLAMPIPSGIILMSRVALVYGLSLLYSGLVWIPGMVYILIFGKTPALAILGGFVLFPFIALFVTVVTCALGWVVALVSTRMKNRSFLVVLLTLVLLGGYYYFCFNMSGLMETILSNVMMVESGVRKWGSLFYLLGLAAQGDLKSYLLFTALCTGLGILCYMILSATFSRILTSAPDAGKRSGKVKDGKAKSVHTALLYREWKRFSSSPTYMLNCGLGILLLPFMSIFLLFRSSMITSVLSEISMFLPDVKQFLPLVIVFMLGVIIAVSVITTPSISLEGKHLWILQTLPVSGREILEAKLLLHVYLNLIPVLFSGIVLCYCLKIDLPASVLILLFSVLFIWFCGAIGLILGLLRPNFHWTSETTPIKQSLNVVISWLAGLIFLILLCGSYYLTWKKMGVQIHLLLCIAVLGIADLALTRWLQTKGDECFERL